MANNLYINDDGTIEMENITDTSYRHCAIRASRGLPLYRPSWVDDAEWDDIKIRINDALGD